MFLQRVTELIDSHGITRNKLLTEIGLNKNSFVVWENRGTVPGGNTLSKLADYFHVSTDYLLGRTDSKEPLEKGGGPLWATLLDNFDQLNQEGQEKLVDASDDMIRSGKYKKSGADIMDQEENVI